MVTIICPQCDEHARGRVVMTHKGEFPTGNQFECPTCGTIRFVTKDKTGGTVGAGDHRGDGRRGTVGVGFGPGTATFRGRRE